MNPNPHTVGQRRIAREDCGIGDWVEAALIPEWTADQKPRVFRRQRISISPAAGDIGGIQPDGFDEWSFVPETRDSVSVWVRES